jgi:hypothetical protein
MRIYGGVFCRCCGRCGHHYLDLDHINDNGNEHVGRTGRRLNGIHLYRWLRRQGYPPGFQVLCACCNKAKRWCKFDPDTGTNLRVPATQEELAAMRAQLLAEGRLRPEDAGLPPHSDKDTAGAKVPSE